MHSVARTVPCGSAAPWQSAPHTSHSLHLAGSLLMRKSENFDSRPSKRAERAEHPAVEAGVDEVQGQGAEEDDGDEGAPLEVALALVETVGRVAGGRQERRREPAPGRGDGIEQPDLRAARRGQAEHHGQDGVLDLVRRPRGVLLHALQHLPLAAQEPEHVVQDAHRAHPPAEEAPEDQRQHDERQGPQQGVVQGVRGERRGQRHQRVELEEPLDVVAADVLRRGGEDQEEEEAEEDGLIGAAQPDEH